MCVTQLAPRLHSAAELKCAVGHLPLQRICSQCLAFCCRVGRVQKYLRKGQKEEEEKEEDGEEEKKKKLRNTKALENVQQIYCTFFGHPVKNK